MHYVFVSTGNDIFLYFVGFNLCEQEGFIQLQNVTILLQSTGRTALHYACFLGHRKSVEILLQAGAAVYIQDKVKIWLTILKRNA